MNSKVALVKCSDYSNVKESIRGVLNLINKLNIFKDKKVLLKVNLGNGGLPNEAINTHPEFVRAVIQIIHEGGGLVSVGDSSNVYGFTDEAFKLSGIDKVVFEEGATLLNFDKCKIIKKNINGNILDFLYLPEDLFHFDIRISLPKLKTHDMFLFTGAIKNQMGLNAGATKPLIHKKTSNLLEMANALVDINFAVRFDFAIMDGILGMDGNGPSAGNGKWAFFVAASEDIVALDTICCDLIGIHPNKVLTNRVGAERGLGNLDRSYIDVLGDKVIDLKTNFNLPHVQSDVTFLGIGRLFDKIKYHLKSRFVSPVVNKDKCIKCGVCEAECPGNAILRGGIYSDKSNCIRCLHCYETCPQKAISLKSPFYLKPIFNKVRKKYH